MTWTVTWKPRPEQALARLWTDASDRATVSAAANAIDAALARDPEGVGEGREGNDRILFEPPLAVLYEVDPGDRKVTVFSVWRWPE
jgi:hypothetical protein